MSPDSSSFVRFAAMARQRHANARHVRNQFAAFLMAIAWEIQSLRFAPELGENLNVHGMELETPVLHSVADESQAKCIRHS